MSSRRVGQDQYISLGQTSSRRLQDVFKTSSRHLAKAPSRHLLEVFNTFWRRVLDVFKTSSRRVAKTFSRRLQNVFNTSCKKGLQDIFKKSSKRFEDVLQRYLQDVFKTYHQVKLYLLISLRDVFNEFLRRTPKTVMYRRICLCHTSEKFRNLWSVYKICKNRKNFPSGKFLTGC